MARAAGPRRIVRVEEELHPRRRLEAAAAAVIVHRDRGEHDRHRGGRCGRAREPDRGEVGAENVERQLRERKARAGGDVRGGDDDQRTVAADEVGVRGILEQDLVVVISGEFGAAPGGGPEACPVLRVERARDDLALHVALEKALLVLVEQPVAVEAVRQRGEAAAGHARDHRHRIEQAATIALGSDHLGLLEKLEYAVRERGGARAAAGEGENDEVLAILEMGLARLEPIARVDGLGFEGLVDRACGASGEQREQYCGKQPVRRAADTSCRSLNVVMNATAPRDAANA